VLVKLWRSLVKKDKTSYGRVVIVCRCAARYQLMPDVMSTVNAVMMLQADQVVLTDRRSSIEHRCCSVDIDPWIQRLMCCVVVHAACVLHYGVRERSRYLFVSCDHE